MRLRVRRADHRAAAVPLPDAQRPSVAAPPVARRRSNRAGDHERRRGHRRVDHGARRGASTRAGVRAGDRADSARTTPTGRWRLGSKTLASELLVQRSISGRSASSRTTRSSPTPQDHARGPRARSVTIGGRARAGGPGADAAHRRARRARRRLAARGERGAGGDRRGPAHRHPPSGDGFLRRVGPGARLRRRGARAHRGAAAGRPPDERRGLPARPPEIRGLPAIGSQSRVSPARACALRVIRRVFEQGAYADRAFAGEAAGLEPRDRALAMALSLRHRPATRDARLRRRATDRSSARAAQPPVLAALRLGLFELLYLGGTAAHAAVNENVELVKRSSDHTPPGFVNAVLRRAAREGPGLLARIDDGLPRPQVCSTPCPAGWPIGGGASSAPRRRGLYCGSSTTRPSPRCGSTRSWPPSRRSRPHCRCRAVRPRAYPRGSCSRARSTSRARSCGQAGAIQPQSRASMLVSRMLGPRARASGCSICARPPAARPRIWPP